MQGFGMNQLVYNKRPGLPLYFKDIRH